MTHYWISIRASAGDGFLETTIDSYKAHSATIKPAELAPRALYLAWDQDRAPKPSDGSVNAAAWTKKLLAEANLTSLPAAKQTNDIVFLVHGYNSSVEDVYQLHKTVQSTLNGTCGFPCTVISFDWPSGRNPLMYLADQHTANLTAQALVNQGIRLFSKASSGDCTINVHVVAHSMGTYVVQQALASVPTTNIPDGTWSLAQVALLAADLASDSLLPADSDSFGLYKYATRITNYFSGYDDVLLLSNAKRLGLYPRAGRVGVPIATPDKLIDVDCSMRYHAEEPKLEAVMPTGSAYSHSWYFYDAQVMADLANVLKSKLDRNVFVDTRTPASGINSFTLK